MSSTRDGLGGADRASEGCGRRRGGCWCLGVFRVRVCQSSRMNLYSPHLAVYKRALRAGLGTGPLPDHDTRDPSVCSDGPWPSPRGGQRGRGGGAGRVSIALAGAFSAVCSLVMGSNADRPSGDGRFLDLFEEKRKERLTRATGPFHSALCRLGGSVQR